MDKLLAVEGSVGSPAGNFLLKFCPEDFKLGQFRITFDEISLPFAEFFSNLVSPSFLGRFLSLFLLNHFSQLMGVCLQLGE